MKKIIVLCLIVSLLTTLLVGCKKEEKNEETADAYAFSAGDVSVAVNAEAAPILQALGAWLDYAESPSCAFEGMDKIYTYQGFELETYCLDGTDYIASIRLLDDSVKTTEGIAIGSTKEAVTDVYGSPDEQTDTAFTYQSGDMKLQFLFRDGSVSDIQYLMK